MTARTAISISGMESAEPLLPAPSTPNLTPRVPCPSTERGNEESHPVQSRPEIPPASRKLDLRGLPAPVKLAEARLEDLTIDGICGVY